MDRAQINRDGNGHSMDRTFGSNAGTIHVSPQCCACNGTCCHTGPHTYCARHGGSLAVPSPPSLPDPNLSSHVAQRCPVCQGSGRWYGPLGNHTGGEECHGCLGRGWVVV